MRQRRLTMAEFCVCDVEVCEVHKPINADFLRAEAQFENYLENGVLSPFQRDDQKWAWLCGWRACNAARDKKIAQLRERVREQGFAIEQASRQLDALEERMQGQ